MHHLHDVSDVRYYPGMTIRRVPGKPVYQQIADSYRQRIERGDFGEAGKLPTEPQVAKEQEVTVTTARRALTVLKDEGLIESRPPLGWFVRSRQQQIYRPQDEGRSVKALSETESWVQQIKSDGRKPQQTIQVAIERAPELVATRLALAEDENVLARKRIRFINDEPININNSYFPMSIAGGTELESPADIERGTSYPLAQRGIIQCRSIHEIDVRMPTPDEKQKLDIDAGTPVAVHIVTTFSTEDNPVRCSINVLPGDRHHIMFTHEWDPEG